jgi:hypothetical protein
MSAAAGGAAPTCVVCSGRIDAAEGVFLVDA